MEGLNVGQIWADYGSRVRQYLAKRVASPEDAEDLLQDILLKTHRYLTTHQQPEQVQAWVFRVARNTLTDYYRTRSSIPKQVEITGYDNIPEALPDAHTLAHRELSHCLDPFLLKLPVKYREAIQATDLDGLSQKNLAQALGVSHSTVKSRVQRGRQMLRALFRDCCAYEMDARGHIRDFEEKAGGAE